MFEESVEKMERNKLKQTAATIYVNEHHKGLDSVTQRTRSRRALSRVRSVF